MGSSERETELDVLNKETERVRAARQERLAVEQRDARLERLREAQQERLAAETAEQRDARLERL